jgi:hypothetical protein
MRTKVRRTAYPGQAEAANSEHDDNERLWRGCHHAAEGVGSACDLKAESLHLSQGMMAEESVPERSGNWTKRRSATWFGSISGLRERSCGHSSRVCKLYRCGLIVQPSQSSHPSTMFARHMKWCISKNLPKPASNRNSNWTALARRSPFPRLPTAARAPSSYA